MFVSIEFVHYDCSALWEKFENSATQLGENSFFPENGLISPELFKE